MGASSSVHDTYHLQKVKLGEGSFGVVFRAVHRKTSAVVAVKQLSKLELPRRGVKRQDIDREIEILKIMRHENIIELFEVFEDKEHVFMAIEYCDGGDFGDKLLERGLDMEEVEVMFWLAQMLFAIAFMHGREVCHRDIKPDNFLVASSSEQPRLKLADLGLATNCPRGRLLTQKCGTPAFMAPEQHSLPSKSRGYWLPVDVWAAGICMYMLMFGGKHPFLDARNRLDYPSLSEGKLSWSASGGILATFGFGGTRMSDRARQLCHLMVAVDARSRIPAAEAATQVSKALESLSPQRTDGSDAAGENSSPSSAAQPPPPPASLGRGSVTQGKQWLPKLPKLPSVLRRRSEIVPPCGVVWEFAVQGRYQPYQFECHDVLEESFQQFLAGGLPTACVNSLGRAVEINFGCMEQHVLNVTASMGSIGRVRKVRRREARR